MSRTKTRGEQEHVSFVSIGMTSRGVDVDELKKYDGREFVNQAYLAILRREADGNAEHFVKLLNKGTTKDRIIFLLRTCSEGIGEQVPIFGLELEKIKASELLKYNDNAFIHAVYLVTYGRTATDDELYRWGQKLVSDHYEKGAVLQEMVEGISDKTSIGIIVGIENVQRKFARKNITRELLYKIPIIGGWLKQASKIRYMLVRLDELNKIKSDILMLNDEIYNLNKQVLLLNKCSREINRRNLSRDTLNMYELLNNGEK